MRRREFVAGVTGAALWPILGRAQQLKPSRYIGWLVTGSPIAYRHSLSAFRTGLKAHGLIEGENIHIEYRWAEGNLARLVELAAELTQEKVEVILAGGAAGARAAKNATPTIPIVTAGAGDLFELGLVKNLTKPEGNLTGFVANSPSTVGKRLELVRELLPGANQLAVIWNPTDLNARREYDLALELGRTAKLELTFHPASHLDELSQLIMALQEHQHPCIAVLNDPFMFSHRKAIVTALANTRIPGIYGYREYVEDGGLVSYGQNISESYRQAAEYVAKILKGESLADLPVQTSTKFELVVNL